MGTASGKVDAFGLLEAVVRTQVQHLLQRVRHGKRAALVQGELRRPVGGGKNPLGPDSAANVPHADVGHLVQSTPLQLWVTGASTYSVLMPLGASCVSVTEAF